MADEQTERIDSARAIPHAARPARPIVSNEMRWALILTVPYLLVFALFVIYPIGYGLYLGSNPDSYTRLFDDPIYMRTLRNTLFFVVIGVNLKMILALVLSGYFFSQRWWIAAIFLVFILPWAIPSIPTTSCQIALTDVHRTLPWSSAKAFSRPVTRSSKRAPMFSMTSQPCMARLAS